MKRPPFIITESQTWRATNGKTRTVLKLHAAECKSASRVRIHDSRGRVLTMALVSFRQWITNHRAEVVT